MSDSEEFSMDLLVSMLDDHDEEHVVTTRTTMKSGTNIQRNAINPVPLKTDSNQDGDRHQNLELELKRTKEKLAQLEKQIVETKTPMKDTSPRDAQTPLQIKAAGVSYGDHSAKRLLEQKITTVSTITSNKEQQHVYVDAFSGIRIINPLVSSSEMRERMTGRKMVPLAAVRRRLHSHEDIEGDWVTIGVVVHKTDTRKSAKGNVYSVWKLCDLKDCSKAVALFLFGKNHDSHWKTTIGSVVGILNATFMSERDSKNNDEPCLTVDHPAKIMMMGTSKDYGLCRGRRKDGAACTVFINKSDCEYCPYHIQKEYRKSSAKRMDLQASYSGIEPRGLRAKLLKSQQVMYGGKLYVNPGPKNINKGKNGLRLQSLKLQKKANELMISEKKANSADFEKLLAVPTCGSRNYLGYLQKDENCASTSSKPLIKSVTPTELLQLHSKQMESLRTSLIIKQEASKENSTLPVPKLAKGFRPGATILLDDIPNAKQFTNAAKQRAIQRVQSGAVTLRQADPNGQQSRQSTEKFRQKIRKRLSTEFLTEEPLPKKPRAISTEDILRTMNRTSHYEHLLDEEMAHRREQYFDEMEKKERIEAKMCSTMQVQCKAVSCQKCQYTAFTALESCRSQAHPLAYHNAVKRFFKCNDCNKRTTCLSKLPTKPCSGCGGKNFERVAMCAERKGPKLDSESLLIRGVERKFVEAHCVGDLNL